MKLTKAQLKDLILEVLEETDESQRTHHAMLRIVQDVLRNPDIEKNEQQLMQEFFIGVLFPYVKQGKEHHKKIIKQLSEIINIAG